MKKNIRKVSMETAKQVDETIENVCKRIKERHMLNDDYADMVKALAALVEARAKLC